MDPAKGAIFAVPSFRPEQLADLRRRYPAAETRTFAGAAPTDALTIIRVPRDRLMLGPS